MCVNSAAGYFVKRVRRSSFPSVRKDGRPYKPLSLSLSLFFFVQLDETQTLNGKTVLEKVGAREGCIGVYNEGHMSAAGR